ncbi:hypothetical protein IJG72_03180 [bacterium]|nr:hypothetical protein [bacterium]
MQVESVNHNGIGMGKAIALGGGIGAIGGAALVGGAEYLRQKDLLAKGDAYIKSMKGEIAREMEFCTPFHKGTQEAADIAKQALQNKLEQAKQFIKNGKIDFGQVTKRAGIAALILGSVFAALGGILKLAERQDREYVRENAKILAEELNKVQK